MTDPSEEEFRAAIVDVGNGRVTQGWMETAWEAARMWIAGSLATSPYSVPGSQIQQPLHIVWQWEKGTLTVSVFRG